MGGLGDIGIMYTCVRFGMLGVVFYLVFFLGGFKAGIENRQLNNNLDLLCLGICFSVLCTIINIDIFFAVYAFSVPFCIALFAYSQMECINDNRQ